MWADTWARAWPAADVDAIASLYAEDAEFCSHPFRARQAPREYVTWAFRDQVDAECRFGTAIVAGDRAAVEWWAAITSADQTIEILAGTSLLRFDSDGRVVSSATSGSPHPAGTSCRTGRFRSPVLRIEADPHADPTMAR